MVLTIQIGDGYIAYAYSRALDAEDRTDRVIATKWDASFCLFDGVPDQQEIDRLAGQVSTRKQVDIMTGFCVCHAQINLQTICPCGSGACRWQTARS